MGFDLTKYFDADLHECTVTFPNTDTVLVVVYRPRALSTAHMATAERDERDGVSLAPRSGLADTLTEILASWDFSMNGEPWPLTRENVNALPDVMMMRIFEAVVEDAPKASAPEPKA